MSNIFKSLANSELLELELFEKALKRHIVAIILLDASDEYYMKTRVYRDELKIQIKILNDILKTNSY